MALQLGALRDALLSAGVPEDKANSAAEEVAGYENRLTRLTTLVQVSIGILVMILASQAGLWSEYGKLSVQMSRVAQQVDQIKAAVVK